MQTRTLGDLILLIESLLGGTFNNVSEMRTVLRLINRRLTTAYNTTPMWERYLVISEERQLAVIKVEGSGTYDGYYIKNGESSNAVNSAFADADIFVKSNDKDVVLYKSSGNKWNLGVASMAFTYTPITDIATFASNSPTSIYVQDSTDTGNYDKPSGVELWVGTGLVNTNKINLVVSDVSTVIYEGLDFPILDSSLTIGNENTIQQFIRIHRSQSFLDRSAAEYDFYVDLNGANVLNSFVSDDKVFVTYKKPLTLITHTESGANDDAVRDGYRSSSSTVPGEFFSYIAHSVFADLLRSESQFQDALREEAVAENYLSAELEKLDIIANNNNLNKKFSTHLNRNSR